MHASHMLGRSQPCSLCAWAGNRRCPECHGKAFVPTPLRRSAMRAIRQAMGIKQRYFLLQDVRRFLAHNPGFIRLHSPKPRGLPSFRSLLLSAVLELNGLKTDLGKLGDLGWPSGKGDAISETDWNSTDGLIHFPFTKDVIETPQTLALAFDIFDRFGLQHSVLGTFAGSGQPLEVSFSQSEPDYLFDTGFVPSLGSRLLRFLELGVKHIFLGYDHFCFLLALIVVSRFRELIKIVTAFTIAHTLTLILTATQIVTLPMRLVEAGIALTIVYVALENLWIKSTNKRWRLAFCFGLIHGFGFANLLQQLGLPPSGLIRPLVSFNVGVEIAQLAIVLALLPVSVWLAQWQHGAKIKNAVSFAIFLLGLGWFSIRAFNLKIPGLI